MILAHLPETSALYRVRTKDWRWDFHAQLLASIHDLLANGNWQRAGKPNAPKPKPLPRPGVHVRKESTFGAGTSMSLRDADVWLAAEGTEYVEDTETTL